MKYSYFAVTKDGIAQAARLQTKFSGELLPVSDIKSAYAKSDALIFVMAAGSVLRILSPFMDLIASAPAILVIDQHARFVIPLLPGHTGSANEIACDLAAFLGAQAVITTAADRNQVISFERVAQENQLRIFHAEAMEYLQSLLMQGVCVDVHTDHEIVWGSAETDRESICIHPYDPEDQRQILRAYQLCCKENAAAVFLTSRNLQPRDGDPYPEHILILSPQDVVVGIDCHSRVHAEYMYEALQTTLERQSISESSIRMFATIPMKAQEPAIQILSGRTGIPLTLLETEDVRKVEYRFRQAPFEKHSNHSVSVSAPCAYLASEKGRMLLISVTFPGGATLSIAQQRKAIRI